jgi:hypothetical protein
VIVVAPFCWLETRTLPPSLISVLLLLLLLLLH